MPRRATRHSFQHIRIVVWLTRSTCCPAAANSRPKTARPSLQRRCARASACHTAAKTARAVRARATCVRAPSSRATTRPTRCPPRKPPKAVRCSAAPRPPLTSRLKCAKCMAPATYPSRRFRAASRRWKRPRRTSPSSSCNCLPPSVCNFWPDSTWNSSCATASAAATRSPTRPTTKARSSCTSATCRAAHLPTTCSAPKKAPRP